MTLNLGGSQSDVVVTSISFGEGVITIQYLEEREQSTAAAIARSILIDTDHIEEELDELTELARDIVDKGVLLIRNPPKRLRRRPVEEGEVEDDDTDDVDEPAAKSD